ncbi:MAG TPA: helix-turn-helix domain-containing protein [Streptosporangiaceae bacterium]|nr:helix-turn-helix domain-containing protein [Streptosporangiaceae bacterium]
MHNKTANSRAGQLRAAGGTHLQSLAGMSRRGRRVALVVYDGLAMFEFGVACDVFGTDWSRDVGVPWYQFAVCAAGSAAVTVEGGYQLQVQAGLGALRRADTILVPPTADVDRVPIEVVYALRQAHGRGARIVSLCTGAFVLAAAGLLAGRRATTHWSECEDLARQYPDVLVDPAVLYVDNGDIMTSAGSAAGIDLCLHLVRLDYGAEVAARLARQLVVPPYRDGGQAQFIDAPLPAVDGADLFTDTLAWMQEHLDLPLTVDDLASRSAMSRRTFARRFAAATGTTPYQWLLRQRLQLAQRLLETSDIPVDSIARKTGFSTAANLRKHFGRLVRTSPQAYRHSFRARDAGQAQVSV